MKKILKKRMHESMSEHDSWSLKKKKKKKKKEGKSDYDNDAKGITQGITQRKQGCISSISLCSYLAIHLEEESPWPYPWMNLVRYTLPLHCLCLVHSLSEEWRKVWSCTCNVWQCHDEKGETEEESREEHSNSPSQNENVIKERTQNERRDTKPLLGWKSISFLLFRSSCFAFNFWSILVLWSLLDTTKKRLGDLRGENIPSPSWCSFSMKSFSLQMMILNAKSSLQFILSFSSTLFFKESTFPSPSQYFSLSFSASSFVSPFLVCSFIIFMLSDVVVVVLSVVMMLMMPKRW